jgi:hypothetical protein
MNRMAGMCLNWKVVAGLAAAGLGIWAAAPNLLAAALPLLLLAVCPLSMLLMMRGMRGGQCAASPTQQPAQASQPAGGGLTPEERLAELKAQLASTQAHQEIIAREITRLEAAEPAGEAEADSTPVVREADAVTRAADPHVQRRP